MSPRSALLFVSTLLVVLLLHAPTARLMADNSIDNSILTAWLGLFQPDPAMAVASLSPVVPPPARSPILSGSPAAPAASPPPLSVKYHFYPIQGTTADELRSQMLQTSPVSDPNGNSFDALTRWDVHWNFHFARSGKSCSPDAVSSRVDVLFTLPQWRVPNFVSSDLQTEWADYIKALKLHEEGHKKNGIDAAQAVQQALNRLPEYPDCQQLEKAAKQVADRVIADYNQRDIAYDRATGHGRTQGAVFPLKVDEQKPH